MGNQNKKTILILLIVVSSIVLMGYGILPDRLGSDADKGISYEQEGKADCTEMYTLSNPSADCSEPNTTETENTLPESTEPPEKVIYLTFDDGPGKNTRKLLDILKKYDVKATFFLINSDYAYLIDDISAEGHAVGIHSASHKYRQIYSSCDAYFKDLYKMQQVIKDYSGKTTMLLRFPGGSSNTVSSFNPGIMTKLTKAVTEQGFAYFDWNVDSGDAGSASSTTEVYNNVTKGIKNKDVAVVLQHDTQGFSVDAVEQIIEWGKKNGYTFLPLDETSPQCHHDVSN